MCVGWVGGGRHSDEFYNWRNNLLLGTQIPLNPGFTYSTSSTPNFCAALIPPGWGRNGLAIPPGWGRNGLADGAAMPSPTVSLCIKNTPTLCWAGPCGALLRRVLLNSTNWTLLLFLIVPMCPEICTPCRGGWCEG